MKKIITIIFSLLFITSYSNSEIIETHHYEKISIEAAKSVTKFGDVFVVCEIDVCRLVCRNIGDLTCSFDNGFLDPRSCACLDERILFDEGNGQDMFDYADSQIDNDVYEGIYSNNLIISNDVVIYRTVEWSYDEILSQRYISLVMTKVTPE